MWISRHEYQRLLSDIEFWRDRADREQKRADAAIDQALTEAGRQPLALLDQSPDTRVAAVAMRAEAEKTLKMMHDMEVDDDGSDATGGEFGDMLNVSVRAVEALSGVR